MTDKNNEFTLKAISPIDGRYSSQIDKEINDINSEYGLIQKRTSRGDKMVYFPFFPKPYKEKIWFK
jgi:hypothetical protein